MENFLVGNLADVGRYGLFFLVSSRYRLNSAAVVFGNKIPYGLSSRRVMYNRRLVMRRRFAPNFLPAGSSSLALDLERWNSLTKI